MYYDFERFDKFFLDNCDELYNSVMQEVDNNIDNVSNVMESLLDNAHHHSKIKSSHTKIQDIQAATRMEKANTEFSE